MQAQLILDDFFDAADQLPPVQAGIDQLVLRNTISIRNCLPIAAAGNGITPAQCLQRADGIQCAGKCAQV